MKKVLSIILVLLLMVSLISACSSQTEKTNSNESGDKEGAKDTSSDYPTKTIQIIAPVKPGGSTDTSARLIAQYLQDVLGQPVVVVNQDGGGGQVGSETVRNAKPDGYTLLYTHTMLHTSYYTGKYDHSYRDFKPISTQSAVNETITVHADSPWKSLKELVDDAKSNPGKYTFGVQLGSVSHFMAGALMDGAGVEFNVVSAGGEAEKLAAMQGGTLHVIMASVGSGKNYTEAGKMRVLAVASEKRDPTAPEFPTAKEQGYEVLMPAMHTLYGPKDLPDEIVKVINDAMAKLSENKEFNEKLNAVGQVFEYRTPEDTLKFIEQEDARIKKLAEKLGFKK